MKDLKDIREMILVRLEYAFWVGALLLFGTILLLMALALSFLLINGPGKAELADTIEAYIVCGFLFFTSFMLFYWIKDVRKRYKWLLEATRNGLQAKVVTVEKGDESKRSLLAFVPGTRAAEPIELLPTIEDGELIYSIPKDPYNEALALAEISMALSLML